MSGCSLCVGFAGAAASKKRKATVIESDSEEEEESAPDSGSDYQVCHVYVWRVRCLEGVLTWP